MSFCKRKQLESTKRSGEKDAKIFELVRKSFDTNGKNGWRK